MKGNNSLVGSNACKSCHAEIFSSFIQTGHKSTSMPPREENIKGRFDKGENGYWYNAYDGIVMQKTDTGFYQHQYYDRKFVKAHRFDIVIGSGKRGQSYLYWNNSYLFQLPISYYTNEDTWSNSPGYDNGIANFSRLVNSQCLGCHSSHIGIVSNKEQTSERFDKASVIYGINCERCHGPGGNHIAAFKNNAGNAEMELSIVNAGNLSRQIQLDACAVCHSGNSPDLSRALDFATGDTLQHPHIQQYEKDEEIDVHGNQYGSLIQSKCFTASSTMTCSSCHNPHVNKSKQLHIFSQKCMSCHVPKTETFCKNDKKIKTSVLAQNCIDCHMPNKESKILNVKLESEDNNTPAIIRSHLIKVYPEETQSISSFFYKSKNDF